MTEQSPTELSPKVMILAAGIGSRFQPHTFRVPKPALPFLNVPLAAWGLQLLQPLNPKALVVNTFHLPQEVESLFSNTLPALGFPIRSLTFSHEKDFIRGSGGGLKFAENFFAGDENLLLINSDEVFFPRNIDFIQQAYQQHLASGALATLITMEHPEVGKKFGGVWTDANDKVIGFSKTTLPGSARGQHFIGIQFLSRRVFRYLDSSRDFNIFYDGLALALSQGEVVNAFPVQGTWFETGSLADFLAATRNTLRLLDQDNAPECEFLRKFLAARAPHSSLQRYADQTSSKQSILAWADASAVFNSTQIIDFAVLGAHAIVGNDSSIEASVIASGVQLKQSVHHKLLL